MIAVEDYAKFDYKEVDIYSLSTFCFAPCFCKPMWSLSLWDKSQ